MIILQTEEDAAGTKRFTTPISLLVSGDFGGGTLTLSMAPGTIEEADLVDGDFTPFKTLDTDSTELAFNVLPFGPYFLRATLADSTAPDLLVRTI